MPDTLLAAAELWHVEGDTITLQTGLYDLDCPLRGTADGLRLTQGMGLAGMAWKVATPSIVTDFSVAAADRPLAAAAAGFGAAVLIPQFKIGQLTSVLVLFLRGGTRAVGAAELWTGGSGSFELAMGQAWHAGKALQRFANISKHVHFPQGAGLPGRVWENGRPELVPDVSEAKTFLRSSGDGGKELSVGLGLPLIAGIKLQAVLLLLSARTGPIARVHEIWEPDPDDPDQLVRRQGTYGLLQDFADASAKLSFSIQGKGEGLPGRAWATRQPVLIDDLDHAGLPRRETAHAAGLTHGLAIPTVVADTVRSVVVLLW